jgi:hypothetical protein
MLDRIYRDKILYLLLQEVEYLAQSKRVEW